MILKLSLDLPEDEPYVRMTRRVTRAVLDDLRVVPDDIDEIAAIVSELCANVILHADGERFRVDMEYYHDRVVLVVADRGAGFAFWDSSDAGSERPDPRTAGARRVGGFGLNLVRAMADRLEFLPSDPRGTTVRAEKCLDYRSDADADAAEEMDQSPGVGKIVLSKDGTGEGAAAVTAAP